MPEVPPKTMAVLFAFFLLMVGTAFGYLVQFVATAIQKNGAWPSTPVWKKRMIGWSGSIAAFTAGTGYLSIAPTFAPEEVIFKLWFAQMAAAWIGSVFMDAVAERVRGKGGPK